MRKRKAAVYERESNMPDNGRRKMLSPETSESYLTDLIVIRPREGNGKTRSRNRVWDESCETPTRENINNRLNCEPSVLHRCIFSSKSFTAEYAYLNFCSAKFFYLNALFVDVEYYHDVIA